MKWLVLLLPLYMAQNLIGNYVLTTSYLEMEYKILNQNENIVPGSMTALQANNYVWFSYDYTIYPTNIASYFDTSSNIYSHISEDTSSTDISFSMWVYFTDDNPGFIWGMTDSAYEYSYYILRSQNGITYGGAPTDLSSNNTVEITGIPKPWTLSVTDSEILFTMNVPVLKTEGLFEISLPKYETFAGFGISLGKLNNEVTGFRGFIYSFQVYDYLINDIGSLYSTSDCDSYCVVVNTDETDFPLCFPDKTCPDFSLIYPSSVSEFPGLNFCDEACNEACQDMTPEGCTACPDPSLEVCDCEVNYQKKYRGIHNGCTACDARKCFECDDENEVCLVCRNPNASPSGADCICKDGFYEKDDSCYFECGKDCLNCEDGQKNYCHDCRDPNAQASDGVCSCSGPYLATNAASEALKCVNPCIGDCYECSIAPNYCTSCLDLNAAPLDGKCVCNDGYYTTSYIWEDDGKKYLLCKSCEECEPCDPECYECLETRVNQDTCQDMTYGYQLKFISGNITLSFSEKLDRDLIKNDYTVIDKNGNSIVTEDWVLLKMTDLEYVIQTNLTKSDLPINLQLTFDQKS